jgi:hypothetical protein
MRSPLLQLLLLPPPLLLLPLQSSLFTELEELLSSL